MALQAPERRGKSLQEDLERAYALSAAEKRLGPHFPPVEDSSHTWHFDGTEHKGGGFDPDNYAYKTRGDIRREWEVSVVQWARERDQADQGWAAENVTRGQDRGPKTIWAPEEADIREARHEVEEAWVREQRDLEGLTSPKSKGKERPKTYSVPVIPESVDARRLSEQHYRPVLREENPAARTHAWLNGRGEAAGVREHRTDPTEQNEIHTMDLYEEELRLKHRAGLAKKPQTPEIKSISDKQSDRQSDVLSEKQSERHSRRYSAPVRQISKGSSSKPPTLPSKIFRNEDLVETPRSESVVLSPGTEARVNSRIAKASEPRAPSRRRSVASERSIPQSIPQSEEIENTIPPSLPSKDSRPGSPDSMATESRQTIRSAIETEPEPIQVFSPTAEESPTIHIQPRPASSRTKRGDSLLDKDSWIPERPLSFPVMTAADSYPDLKQKDVVSIRTIQPEEHVRSSATSWINMPPPGSHLNERLLDETLIHGPHGHSELSMTTLVSGADRNISPAAQLAQRFRQQIQEAAADPMNPAHLREMSFTVPAMFSRSTVGIHEPVPEEAEEHVNIVQDEEIYTTEEEPITPRQRLSHVPHPIRLPESGNNSSDSPNIDKSLPPTPYTTTHSNISQPQFDADALEAEQQTEASYYRHYRDSMPPDYSSGSKTPKGSYGKDSLDKTPHDSLVSLGAFKNHMKSNVSLHSAKTGSTGAMGDVEPDEAPMKLRNAERRPSKKVKHRPKPEGSQASSDGSASTIKASNQARSNSSASESGDSHRARHERHQKRSEEHHSRSNSKRKVREGLPPGTSHTKISYSDSESEQSKEDAQTFGPEIIHKSSADSSPLSVDASDDDAQYVMAPDLQESQAPGRLSAHTFGLPTGTSMAFRDSRDLRSLKNESNQTIPTVQSGPSRPLSMAPSMRSNRTRASTLRASMRSPPLPDISERDTTSELSDRGDIMALNGSGSLVGMLNVIAPAMGSSSEVLREGGEGGAGEGAYTPTWRRDIWNAVAKDAASTRRSSLAKVIIPVSRFSTTQGSAPPSSRGHGSAHGHGSRSGHGHGQDLDDVKSSSSSLGEELKENFSLQHPPNSYHGSQRNSIAQGSQQDHQGRHSQNSQNSQQDARGSRRNSMSMAQGNHSSGSLRESMARHSRRNSTSMAQGHSSGMEERDQGSSGRGTGVGGAGVGNTGNGSGSGSGNKGHHSSSTGHQRSGGVGAWIDWNEDSEVGMAGVGAHGLRAKVSYKEPTPMESDNYWSD